MLHVLSWNIRLMYCLDFSVIQKPNQNDIERLNSIPEYHTVILKCLVREYISLAILISPYRLLSWWCEAERTGNESGRWLRSVPVSWVTGSHICFVKRGPLVLKSLEKIKKVTFNFRSQLSDNNVLTGCYKSKDQ